ncbi:2':5'-phosphodiesterase 12-like protein [Leptotrombidium deliense]|uniref:2',5'-phosphodiesterase 12 n=1 Tax=Leptotrombidium deliense TaxID=299467 RepID=A0A443SML8_9ACAR|nr:2':5'-phosphodiesterase 12-like protein [Leptotrombidium deliense]
MLKSFCSATFAYRTLFSCKFYTQFARMLSTRNAAVRLDDSDKISLSFHYKVNENERLFTFNRNKDESLNVLFDRMRQNIIQKLTRRKKIKRKEAEDLTPSDAAEFSLPISLVHENVVVDETLPHSSAWRDGSILKVGENEYDVIVNAPVVKSLKLPKCLLAGFDIYPIVVVDFCDEDECKYFWYKRRSQLEKKMAKASNNESSDSSVGHGGWILAAEGFSYKPDNGDIGRQVKLKCVPFRGDVEGVEVVLESKGVIEAGPGICPFEERHAFTKDVTESNSFRFVSYNILADLYADSDHSRTVLFPYCPPNYLDFNYRKHLLIKELLGYNGDIICLQEVDKKFYTKTLSKVMKMNAVEGVFHEKGEESGEGLACFYRKSKFELITSSSVTLCECVDKDPQFEKLKQQLKQNETFYERFMKRKTIMQYALLRSTENQNKAVLVGNTHLYFHPDSDHIRLIQSSVCINFLEHLLQLYSLKHRDLTISPLLCGDFNSCPEFGVYKLMITGFVDDDSEDWSSNTEEALKDVQVSHSLSLSSACGTPEYTNYTPTFSGCLDYIFYDNVNLKVEEVIPFPSHEQVTQLTAIPNALFPSDHLALVTKLKWNC